MSLDNTQTSRDELTYDKVIEIALGDDFDDIMHLVRGSSPEDVAQKFIKTTTNNDIYVAHALLSLCIIAAISNRKTLESYIDKRCKDVNDIRFFLVLQHFRQEWMLNNRWNYSILHLAGQCILETGHSFESSAYKVKAYREKIGANSIYSPNFVIHPQASAKSKSIIADKRAKFTRKQVYDGGMKIFNHLYALKKRPF